MSVEMKLGRWADGSEMVHNIDRYDGFWHESSKAWWWDNKGRFYGREEDEDPWNLVRYLGPLDLSPTPACAEAGPAGDLSTVSTEDPQEQLQRMRNRYNAIEREASIYSGLLAALDQAKSDLYERIRALEKEVEG